MSDGETDNEAIERAIQKARDEVENFDGEDYIGNRPVFILWQYLGGIDMPESMTLTDYKPIVKQWYGLSDGLLVDESGEPLTFTEVWGQFVEVCGKDKVKYFKRDCLELAKQRAKRHKKPLPELAEYDQAHRYLGAVLYELQEIAGDGSIWLSSYDAGEILDKDQKRGLRAMNMFVADGILCRLKAGNRHYATEYKYIGKVDKETAGEPNGPANPGKLTPEQFRQRKKGMLKRLRESRNDDTPEIQEEQS